MVLHTVEFVVNHTQKNGGIEMLEKVIRGGKRVQSVMRVSSTGEALYELLSEKTLALMREAERDNDGTLPLSSQQLLKTSLLQLWSQTGMKELNVYWAHTEASRLTAEMVPSCFGRTVKVALRGGINDISALTVKSNIIEDLIRNSYVLFIVSGEHLRHIIASDEEPLKYCSFIGRSVSYDAQPL